MNAIVLNPVQRPRVWRWAVAVLFTVGVMAGLLGMHTFSAGHSGPAAGAMSVEIEAHSHGDSDREGDAGLGGCADCAHPEHHELVMACVLALLATLLVLVVPSSAASTGRDAPSRRGPPAIVRAIGARHPSLHELSISRT
ncbi:MULTISPECIES: DUF6153 family protein [Microbacterium]|uniref:DUF6153 family protein n=1 Tax=Microbacterium TaxID=33882 RepID=UPI00146AD94E|nr:MULTISPECIES: DUF6153 family protein [Microbacterium]